MASVLSREEVAQVVYSSLSELNEQFGGSLTLVEAQPLFGATGGLDSLGFINLVALLEEKCHEKLGFVVSIADVSEKSPEIMATVGNLIDFLHKCATAAGAQS